MKLIQKGEPFNVQSTWKFNYKFVGDKTLMEDGVSYLTESVADVNWEKWEVNITITIIGKKQDFMCDSCGSNFISHKGMCSSCYVRQL